MNDWHFVNLFVPALLPLVFLAAFSLFDLSKTAKVRAHPLAAIKDGQLSWAGLGMCVNGLYELHHLPPEAVLNTPWPTVAFWLMVAMMMLHAFIAALGPIFPTKRVQHLGFRKTAMHYRVLIASALLTLAAASVYSLIHLTTQVWQD